MTLLHVMGGYCGNTFEMTAIAGVIQARQNRCCARPSLRDICQDNIHYVGIRGDGRICGRSLRAAQAGQVPIQTVHVYLLLPREDGNV